MHTTRILTIAGALAAVALAAAPASATVTLDGAVSAQASATVNGDGEIVGPRGDSWSGAPHDLSTSAGALVDQQALVLTKGTITANWSSADLGSVHISDRGWTVEGNRPGVTDVSTDLTSADPDWTYAFQAEGDGSFDLNFELIGSGDTFGLATWNLVFSEDDGPGQHNTLTQTFPEADFDVTGGFTHALATGHRYRVSLFNQEGMSDNSNRSRSNTENGVFNWSINTIAPAGVPEPSTWALSIVGFGLAGASLRRRNRSAVAA